MPLRGVPGAASAARPEAAPGSDKLTAPAAARNTPAIRDLLLRVAPERGHALELASGTGQHAVACASCMPNLIWQPSELDPSRLASIQAYVSEAGLDNLRAPIEVDAAAPGWSALHSGQNLIVLINLLHLISGSEAQVLVREAAAALAPGGRFVLYGPFLRAGKLTSPGDRAFHATLSAHDPKIGYKDDRAVETWLAAAGLQVVEVAEMPANNLAFIAEKPVG
ncbi:DUF938 domain-containing protein [Cribrihabitans neustonicus]|uniref:DUF938 domain-containing protein n=1 Tax=Cribrihabitans neustonicus TaxID=1429085 RepID=UPI003B5C94B9